MNGVLKTCFIKICQHTVLNWPDGLLMACHSGELHELSMTPHEHHYSWGELCPFPVYKLVEKVQVYNFLRMI